MRHSPDGHVQSRGAVTACRTTTPPLAAPRTPTAPCSAGSRTHPFGQLKQGGLHRPPPTTGRGQRQTSAAGTTTGGASKPGANTGTPATTARAPTLGWTARGTGPGPVGGADPRRDRCPATWPAHRARLNSAHGTDCRRRPGYPKDG